MREITLTHEKSRYLPFRPVCMTRQSKLPRMLIIQFQLLPLNATLVLLLLYAKKRNSSIP